MENEKSRVSLDKVKAFLRSQIEDERNWEQNMRLLRALGLFAGSILVIRNYGDLWA